MVYDGLCHCHLLAAGNVASVETLIGSLGPSSEAPTQHMHYVIARINHKGQGGGRRQKKDENFFLDVIWA
jgi:hypothetical protein